MCLNALSPGLLAGLRQRFSGWDLSRLTLPLLREAVVVLAAAAPDLLPAKLPHSLQQKVAGDLEDVLRVEMPLFEAVAEAQRRDRQLQATLQAISSERQGFI